MSPLIFNLYVNDLPSVVSVCRVYRYAGDTVLVACDADYHVAIQKLQNDLVFMMDWFHLSLIKVNAAKTKFVLGRLNFQLHCTIPNVDHAIVKDSNI